MGKVVCWRCAGHFIRLVRVCYQLGITKTAAQQLLRHGQHLFRQYWRFFRTGELSSWNGNAKADLEITLLEERTALLADRLPDDQWFTWFILWAKSQIGNRDSLEMLLLWATDQIIRPVAKTLKISGYDLDDLIQEGRRAVLKAIGDYQPRFRRSLKNFLFKAVRCWFWTEIKSAWRHKRKANALARSLDAPRGPDNETRLIEIVSDAALDPATIICESERQQALRRFLVDRCAPIEAELLISYLEDPGRTYDDHANLISHRLKRPCQKKSVDNAWQRLKDKIRVDPTLLEICT